jgi:curved DNA-binding protein CbpA
MTNHTNVILLVEGLFVASSKDYYAILGIEPDASPAAIRAAYREAVLRTHPDHAGPDAAADFQEVVEAYAVLSNPDRRREYDSTLEPKGPPLRVDPNARATHPPRRPTRQPGLSIEVLLTPEEAFRGGKVRVDVPLRRRTRPLYMPIPHVIRAGITSTFNFEPVLVEGLWVKIRCRVVDQPV